MLQDEHYQVKSPKLFGILFVILSLLSVGLNCALGADELRQYVSELSYIADVPVSAYPNAGLPMSLESMMMIPF